MRSATEGDPMSESGQNPAVSVPTGPDPFRAVDE
jgi:hypothetical protein